MYASVSKLSKEIKNNIKIRVDQAVLTWVIDPNITFYCFDL